MYKIIQSDIYNALINDFFDEHPIDLAITSPPYWQQRDYGFDGQIGNEESYMEYIARLLLIFDKLLERMSDKGVFFLNVGDKYLSRYGKTPLGFIPYKLAYFMTKRGWILNDILIWYKPNHMPTSVKNRFANSYEPVFVLSKNRENYFTEYVETDENYSNILKVNLQPTPYRHVAVYPEELVEKLINMTNIGNNGVVFDPFAGSGTTGKVVIDMNNSLLGKNLKCILVEMSEEYVDIIKDRCGLQERDIIKLPYEEYDWNNVYEEIMKDNAEDNIIDRLKNLEKKEVTKDMKNGFIKIFENEEEYFSLLKHFFDKNKTILRPDKVCFVGVKKYDIDTIYLTSLLNDHGWVIRNMLVVEDGLKWYPIFMIVDNNKKVNYEFNYEDFMVRHKNPVEINWYEKNFIGYKVLDKLVTPNKEGIVLEILDKYEDGFPKYIKVLWDDNKLTKEFVIYDEKKINKNILFYCPTCGETLEDYYHPLEPVKCYNCDTVLWNDKYPIIKEKESIVDINNSIEVEETLIFEEVRKALFINDNNKKYKYKGKFKGEKKINLGASPGARASTQEEVFSKQRLYNVNQPLICDYLNIKRELAGLSKTGLTRMFPNSYKHTVGHWLRKDFGGSLPNIEDWNKLIDILDLEIEYTNYVCKTALKLQTVAPNKRGKMPSDFISLDYLNRLLSLYK